MHQSREDLMPHIYATSAAAFRGLYNPVASSSELTSVDIAKLRRNQSVIVSGESGAGKTESVKLLMDHIANMSQRANDDMIDKVSDIVILSSILTPLLGVEIEPPFGELRQCQDL